MSRPPPSCGSMATCRSERTSLPKCPASPAPADFSSTEPAISFCRHPERAAFATKDLGEPPRRSSRSTTRTNKREASIPIALLQLLQNRISHLHRARRPLRNRLRSPRNPHHVIGAHFAFPHHISNGLANALRLRSLPDMIQHHRRRKNHGNGIHNGRSELRILRRRPVRRFKHSNLVPDVT